VPSLLNVEPPDYYPIVDKLFADELRDALKSFGTEIQRMDVVVDRKGKTLILHFRVVLEREEGFPIPDMETIISGILDKLADDATSSFGNLYGISFRIGRLLIEEKRREKPSETNTKLIVEGPGELRPILARTGKGLVIKMREWGYRPSTVTLSAEDGRVSVVVKMDSRLSTTEKLTLRKALEDKAGAYLKTLTGKRLPVDVKILDPSDKVLKTIERGKKSVEERIQELLEREEVRSLMDALGKGTPSP